MKILLIVIALLAIIPSVNADVLINEIMYSPSGTDDNHEWVEIYNNGSSVNISAWKFYENNVSHGLDLKQGGWLIEDNAYAAIVDDSDTFLQDYPGFNGTLFDSSFGLNNQEGEFIAMKDGSGNFIDSITYNVSIGADGDGNSLQLINGTWRASAPTPGGENTISDSQEIPDAGNGLEISVILESPLYIGFSYTKLFKIENLDHVAGQTDHINATVYYNISDTKEEMFDVIDLNSFKTADTGSFTPAVEGNFTVCGKIISSTVENDPEIDNTACKLVEIINPFSVPCNISINVTSEEMIYEQGDTIKFYNNLDDESFPYVIEYWIEDLFGEIVKNKINTTNTNSKSYTPKIDEKDRVFIIKNRLYPFCKDASLDDNSAEKLVIIKNEVGSATALLSEEESSLSIEKLLDIGSDKEAKFGESFRVNLEIYKGNTAKTTVTVWMEDSGGKKVGKESKTNVGAKYTAYDITLPVQVPPNCDEKLKDGKYMVMAEGLDEKDRESISIEGLTSSLCAQKASEKKAVEAAAPKPQPTQISSERELMANSVNPSSSAGLIYESTTQKAKNIAPIFFIALTTMLSIVLLWRR